MKYNIPFLNKPIPYITTNQMIEVDRLMIEEYKINLFQMMENAGRCLAIVVKNEIDYSKTKRILVIAGSGGNGGGGMTSARRLHNWGYDVSVLLTSDESKYKGTILSQLQILKNIGVDILDKNDFDLKKEYDIVIDAMIGYSLRGELRSNIVELINWINNQKSIVVSLDVPSGIDSTTGELKPICVDADITMTLALPKIGFKKRKTNIGRLLLADISVPPELYKKGFGIDLVDVFDESDIVEL